MHDGDVARLAVSAGHEDLGLPALSTSDLHQLSAHVSELGSDPHLAPDGALAVRFEWLVPMIDAELRARE